jgi:hypothetical protein
MSSELLASGVDNLKGHLAGAFNVLTGSSGDYTDLGIGRKFGGAAAAYSLRDVGAMNGPVVRVRRDSDNSEQDFSALAVPFIPEWCNRQAIKPLDVKALQSDGRTGDFIIAKAAYSLRSLGDRQATIANDAAPLNADTVVPASGKYVVQVRRNVDGTIKSFTADEVSDGTLVSFVNESFTSSLPLDVQGSAAAAYSLRDLKTGGTSVTSSGDTAGDTTSNYVVQVRRSSDDTIKSFTADSITNGDLLSFVNEHHIVYSSDFSSDVNSFSALDGDSISRIDSFGGEDNVLKFQVGTGSSSHRITRTGGLIANEKMNFSIKVYIPSSNADVNSVLIRDASSNVVISSTTPASDQWVTLSAENLTNITNNVLRIRFQKDGSNFTGNNTDVAYIKDIVTTQVTADGHVATWYDQSGNSNNATQGTAGSQPKIVNSGSLVTGQTGSNGLDVQKLQFFNLTSDITLANFSSFGVIDNNNSSSSPSGGNNPLLGDNSSNTDFFGIGNDDTDGANNTMSLRTGGSEVTANEGDAGNEGNTVVRTHIYNGSTLTGFANSTQTDNTLSQTGSLSNIDLLFARDSADAEAKTFQGTVSEIIIHSSDQSEKRRAIEESIATANGITLASFSRNGAVRTWYDQSVSDQAGSTATGNHAVQTTTAEQPSIVSNGSLHTSGGINFDGFNDELDMPTNLISSINSASAFVVAKTDSTSDTQVAVALSRNDPDFRFYMGAIVSGNFTFGYQDSASKISLGSADTNKHLFTGIAGSSNAEAFLDGTSKGTVSSADGKSALSSGGIGAINSSVDFDGLIEEVIIYNTDQTDNRGAFEANIAEHYNISGVPAEDNQVNGFVETWYDQSGNGNDATQTTATKQPKIVNSGSLLADGVDFDGTDDFLELTSVLGAGANQSIFVVQKSDDLESSSTATIFDNRDSSGQGSSVLIGSGNFKYLVQSASTTAGSSNLNENILTSINNSSNTSAGLNGTLTDGTAGGTIANSGDEPRIGARSYSTAANFYDGSIKEIITYNTDQTSDRADIESNIANHYGITLS